MMTRRFFRYAIVSGLAVASVPLGFNCSGYQRDSSAFSSSSSSAIKDSVPASPVAFMSAEQTLKTMISVTGTEGFGELTDPADAAIKQTYVDRNGSLPAAQDLGQATGPTLISATNLASSVCAKATDRDRATGESQRADRIFFKEIDFSKGLAEQSSDGVQLSFERFARNAWRRDVTQDEIEKMVSFAQEFSTGASPTDPLQTRLLAISICTAAISSIDALTY